MKKLVRNGGWGYTASRISSGLNSPFQTSKVKGADNNIYGGEHFRCSAKSQITRDMERKLPGSESNEKLHINKFLKLALVLV